MKMQNPITPVLSKAMLDAHSAIGVFFGAVLYLVCFSGTLAVMVAEFSLWEDPSGPFQSSYSPAQHERLMENAYAAAKAEGFDHAIYVVGPSAEEPRITVTGYTDLGDYKQWQADAEGNLLPMANTGWSEFMRIHHYQLSIPRPFGLYVVGLAGAIMIASLFSGLIAHRRILKDAFRLRIGGSDRLTNADLHNRVGVWALPFHLIVALTGSLLGLASLFIGIVGYAAYDGDEDKVYEILFGTHPEDVETVAPLPDVRAVLASIESTKPGTEIVWIGYDHVATAGQMVHVATAEPGHLSRAEMWTFAPDGTFHHKAGYTDGSVGMRIYGMLAPLHFGTYGGLPLKLIYVFLGSGLTLIVATGVNIWLARKRTQGYRKPRLERAWTVLVWGQIPAFVLAALTELLDVAPALPVYWAITILPLALAYTKIEVSTLATGARLMGGILLVTLAVLHGLIWREHALIDSVVIDIALATLGALLLWRSVPRTKTAELSLKAAE
ncbi:PepSY-associated TM helix domain-containing protein [Gimibacter soli]|uniref:PepSY-associated TM helix domain-containing protein n=1 Tax=Gimibacter soli TaxID=3024400 RepID=A0AAF0BM67_9PROT|nr:PepSY-associated TM helix domain-containing protein [Gimibacter soli]WCL54121.1 PepSY-associated TM helix domain-containing protein [Gimibacter soli]